MALTEQLLVKLAQLEKEAEDPLQFWLEHAKYLSAQTPAHIKLEFLCPHASSPHVSPIAYHECEGCKEADSVFYEPRLDQYTCHACGKCQERSRSPVIRYVPDSSVYKHSVHLHQILHEMQCLRQSLPPKILGDIKEHVGPPYTHARIKRNLRKLGYQQHYNMIYSIQQALDPEFKPLVLHPRQEDQMQGLFFQYVSLGPIGGRKNRLNYHFVIGKLAQMCGIYNLFKPYLHPPKGEKSRLDSERIWAIVCKKLKW